MTIWKIQKKTTYLLHLIARDQTNMRETEIGIGTETRNILVWIRRIEADLGVDQGLEIAIDEIETEKERRTGIKIDEIEIEIVNERGKEKEIETGEGIVIGKDTESPDPDLFNFEPKR